MRSLSDADINAYSSFIGPQRDEWFEVQQNFLKSGSPKSLNISKLAVRSAPKTTRSPKKLKSIDVSLYDPIESIINVNYFIKNNREQGNV